MGNDKKALKVGLDLHGVISANPDFFSAISKLLVDSGAEVHILTGSHSEEILAELEGYKISYTHLFSIADHHKSIGTPIRYDENGEPWIEGELWSRSKGEYAEKVGLDFHIDDSRSYGIFFKTPYAQIIVKGYDRKIKR
jgi:hypothetical protein